MVGSVLARRVLCPLNRLARQVIAALFYNVSHRIGKDAVKHITLRMTVKHHPTHGVPLEQVPMTEVRSRFAAVTLMVRVVMLHFYDTVRRITQLD